VIINNLDKLPIFFYKAIIFFLNKHVHISTLCFLSLIPFLFLTISFPLQSLGAILVFRFSPFFPYSSMCIYVFQYALILHTLCFSFPGLLLHPLRISTMSYRCNLQSSLHNLKGHFFVHSLSVIRLAIHCLCEPNVIVITTQPPL
jgi:hypothetical protein